MKRPYPAYLSDLRRALLVKELVGIPELARASEHGSSVMVALIMEKLDCSERTAWRYLASLDRLALIRDNSR